jgi:predicted ThiF/HesA family dinucleotide-utilizing enzyme
MGSMGGNNVTIHVNGGDPQSVVDALRRYMQFYGTVPIRTGGV